jgi:hypothetical protein
MNKAGPAAVFVALVGVAAPGAELVTPEGLRVSGRARFARGRLTVAGAAVPADEIISLRLGGGSFTDTIEQGLVLRNGDCLAGSVGTMQAGRIEFVSDTLGGMTLERGSVLAFSLMPRTLTELVASSRGRPGAELANRDFVEGEARWANPETIGVNIGTRIVRAPRERTALVRLGGTETPEARRPEPGRAVQFVRLANGDRLSGSVVSITDEALRLGTELLGEVEIPVAVVVEVWSEGGPLIPLSTVQPVEIRQIPQFDEHFPPRVDLAQAGGFLSVGGVRFERGIGVHSRSEIEYDVSAGFEAFLAEIGIDDGAGGKGEAAFRVLVDGRTAFESGPVRRGEPARLVHVPLGRRARLRLVVDFGPDGSSVGDHADWGRVVLVKRR